MQIVRVRGNVKKGCDLEIGEKTLIIGPNGSGKSSIVNTVELALTGRAGDIAGRVDVAREVDVMSLATDGAGEIEAIAVFADGVNAAYRTSGSTAKAKKATGDKPSDRCHEDVLPIRSLREALLGSPATARKYLLSKMGGDITVLSAKTLIDPELYEMFDRVMAPLASMMPADALVAALEQAGSQAREAGSKAKAAKAAAAFVTGGAAIPPSQEEINAAKKVAAALQAEYADAIASQARSSDVPSIQEELEQAEADAMARVSDYREEQALFDEMKEPVPLGPNFDLAFRGAKISVEEGGCIVCGSDQIDELKQAVHLGEAAHNIYASSVAAYAEAKAKVAAAKREADVAVRAFEKLEQKLREAVEAAQGAAPVGNPEEIKAKYEAANNNVMELQSKRSAWDTAYKAQSQATAAESEAVQWNALKEALTGVVERLVSDALVLFIAQVQSCLPSTDTFDMRLRDGDREVVQFGLVREGKLHTALSGAEWARVMAALADACVPEGRYACIIPEERAFDASTLASVMRALGNSRHQVILTSPVAPKSPPKNWTIIKRGEE